MLNNNQLIAIHLIASGVKASIIANQLNIREETLSRWRQIAEFKEALNDATEVILREIDETHKNLLICSQNVIADALNNQELDLFKKIIWSKNKDKKFCFEIINEVVNNGGKFKCIQDKDIKVIDIDTSKDLQKAQEFI